MGSCVYCGESAGLFRKLHKECELKYQTGISEIKKELVEAIKNKNLSPDLRDGMKQTAAECFIKGFRLESIIISAWEKTIDDFLDDGAIDPNEESLLNNYSDLFELDKTMLDRNGYFTKLVQGLLLHDLMSGKIPQRVDLKGNLPVNLEKDETVIWAFGNTDLYQEKIKRQYVGGSKGVSIRIMKGLYYRQSSFKGEPIDTTYLKHIASGILVVTNKRVIFSSPVKTIKINYPKITATYPYNDGIMIHRDTASQSSLIFITGDGWFTNNLLDNLLTAEL